MTQEETASPEPLGSLSQATVWSSSLQVSRGNLGALFPFPAASPGTQGTSSVQVRGFKSLLSDPILLVIPFPSFCDAEIPFRL